MRANKAPTSAEYAKIADGARMFRDFGYKLAMRNGRILPRIGIMLIDYGQAGQDRLVRRTWL